MGGDFNAYFGSTYLDGACDFYSLLGIGKGKLSYSLGDAVSVVIHDGIIFSLPPTLWRQERCLYAVGCGGCPSFP
jgi:hypothetical protein